MEWCHWKVCVKIMVSEGATAVELGGMELDWNAVARLQPCWVNRFSTNAWGRGWSENLVLHRGQQTNHHTGLITYVGSY